MLLSSSLVSISLVYLLLIVAAFMLVNHSGMKSKKRRKKNHKNIDLKALKSIQSEGNKKENWFLSYLRQGTIFPLFSQTVLQISVSDICGNGTTVFILISKVSISRNTNINRSITYVCNINFLTISTMQYHHKY